MDPLEHPDRVRWNARYAARDVPSFAPHPLAETALALGLPAGPVLDLACGPSGTALAAAEAGRHVTAVDVSDVALRLLTDEAARRGLGGLIAPVHGDLAVWRPEPASYALVLCTGYWDRAIFTAAAQATLPGGVIGWQAFTEAARLDRPQLPVDWCLRAGEPASLLTRDFDTPDFDILIDKPTDRERGRMRQLLARRVAARSAD